MISVIRIMNLIHFMGLVHSLSCGPGPCLNFWPNAMPGFQLRKSARATVSPSSRALVLELRAETGNLSSQRARLPRPLVWFFGTQWFNIRRQNLSSSSLDIMDKGTGGMGHLGITRLLFLLVVLTGFLGFSRTLGSKSLNRDKMRNSLNWNTRTVHLSLFSCRSAIGAIGAEGEEGKVHAGELGGCLTGEELAGGGLAGEELAGDKQAGRHMPAEELAAK